MDNSLNLLWRILLVFVLTASNVSNGDEMEYKLMRDLFRNYDRRIRPSKNASDPLNVTFGLSLAQIIDVDEKNQIITTNSWLNQNWIDNKLTWNPDDYGGIKVIRIPYDAIWRPDILLYNNADVSAQKSSISTNVIVDHFGNVTWLSMVIFKSSCAINVKYFPFDEQNCSMLFSSWTYDGFQVNLMKVGDDGDESNYIPNSEWTLVKLHAKRNVVKYSCCEEPYPDVTYKIQMRRKPLFYVFNMIMPCMLITLVALLGFYIPSDSGEKVTMGITTLLSMTVFLMLVTESMPPTSDVLPLIGMYYGITIAIVSLATAMTVLTLNIHHKGIRGREVPNIIKKIFFSVFARLLCIQLETPEKYVENDILQYPAESNVDDCSGRSSYIKLKRSNQGCSMVDNNMSMTRMSVLDFVPQRQTVTRDTFDADRLPENGGVSPRFLRRLRQTPQNSAPQSLDNLERQFMRVLQKVQQTIEKNEIRLAEQDRRDIIKLEWQQVALVVDRILLYIFVLLTIGVTLCIMFQAPLSLDWL